MNKKPIIPPTDPDELKKWLQQLVTNSERIRKELTSPVQVIPPNESGRDYGTEHDYKPTHKLSIPSRAGTSYTSFRHTHVMCYR